MKEKGFESRRDNIWKTDFSWPQIQCCQKWEFITECGAEMEIFALSVSIVTFFENILVYNWLMFGAITFKRDRNLPKTSFLVILTLWYQRNWKKATVISNQLI